MLSPAAPVDVPITADARDALLVKFKDMNMRADVYFAYDLVQKVRFVQPLLAV